MHGSAEQVAALEVLLGRAERSLGDGAVDAAAAALDQAAEHLRAYDPPVDLMVRAAWLAAAVSLERRDWEGFHQQADNAVALLSAAGQEELAAEMSLARTRAASRTASDDRVRDQGEVGLLDTLALSCGLLLDIYEDQVAGDPAWRVVDDDREQLPELLELVARSEGRPARLAAVVRALALDPIESTLVSVLVPLALYPPLAERAAGLAAIADDGAGLPADFIARLAFEADASRDAARLRLRDGARLAVHELIAVDDGRVRLSEGVAAFFAGDWLSPADDPDTVVLDPADDPPALIEPHGALARAARAAFAGDQTLLVVHGPPGSGRRSVVRAAAAGAGRPVLWIDPVRLADEPAGARTILGRTARDALLWNAVLCAQLEPGADAADALVAAAGDRRVTWAIATDAAPEHRLVAALRRARPALHALEMPELEVAAQVAAWRQVLRQLGVTPPGDAEIEVQLCRPGLAIGDIVTAASAAVGAWDEVDAAALAGELDALIAYELDALALAREPAEPPAALTPEADEQLSGALAVLAAPELVVDPWGVQAHLSGRSRGGALLMWGSDPACGAACERLAAELRAPLYAADLDRLAASGDGATRLGALFRAAGRRGAVLMIEIGPDSEPEVVNRLARELDRRAVVTVITAAVAGDCPEPIRSRVDATVSAGLA